jgi:hypothetical protein
MKLRLLLLALILVGMFALTFSQTTVTRAATAKPAAIDYCSLPIVSINPGCIFMFVVDCPDGHSYEIYKCTGGSSLYIRRQIS